MPTLAATTLEASTASRHTSPRRLKSRQSTATRATRRAQERRLGLADILSNKRSEEHTSELQSQSNLVCRLLLEKKNTRETPEIASRRETAFAGPAHQNSGEAQGTVEKRACRDPHVSLTPARCVLPVGSNALPRD